jgi:phosphatidylglycerol:prolipoprotein diacylglycerol transferase
LKEEDIIMSKKDKKSSKKSKKNAVKPVILLSFDGTIMDTEPAILATYRHIFAKYEKGSEFTKEAAMEVLDSSAFSMMKKYFPEQDPKDMVAEYRSYQDYHLRDLIQPMKGVVDFLTWLKENGYKVGIVSVKDRSAVMDLLEHSNMAQLIDVVIGNAGAGTETLSSDSIITACAIMDAKFCVFIADSAVDMQAGREAGVLCIGFVHNRDKTPALVESHPDFMTASFREIRKLIENEPLWVAYPLTGDKIEDDSDD